MSLKYGTLNKMKIDESKYNELVEDGLIDEFGMVSIEYKDKYNTEGSLNTQELVTRLREYDWEIEPGKDINDKKAISIYGPVLTSVLNMLYYKEGFSVLDNKGFILDRDMIDRIHSQRHFVDQWLRIGAIPLQQRALKALSDCNIIKNLGTGYSGPNYILNWCVNPVIVNKDSKIGIEQIFLFEEDIKKYVTDDSVNKINKIHTMFIE